MKTYYVTKYALTKGIIEVSGEVNNQKYLRAKWHYEWPYGLNGVAYFHPRDWHESLDDAQERADEMLEKKLASLDRQIRKMKSTSVSVYKKS